MKLAKIMKSKSVTGSFQSLPASIAIQSLSKFVIKIHHSLITRTRDRKF